MRIIAGEFRSRRLKTVPGLAVRPTPDRLREALFNVLAPSIQGAVFVDAYAGSGAVGIEALSRGAERAIFIERNARAIAVIQDNLSALGIAERAIVVHGSTAGQLRHYASDIVFLDPPYEAMDEYGDALMALSDMACKLVIAQHESRFVLEDAYGSLEKTRILQQGENALSFFRRRQTTASE